MSTLPDKLAFVDIETNGASPPRGRIIEVGIVRVENHRPIDTFSTLIDPCSPLPYWITRLTGIHSSELNSAPTFREIASQLMTLLDGCVFVAHNVQFDYSFLRHALSDSGIAYSPTLLCTVRLSRSLFPRYPSHKLDDLISRHNLPATSRHRGLADAETLWEWYKLLLREFDLDTIARAMRPQLRR